MLIVACVTVKLSLISAALMLEWGILEQNQIFIQTTAIENYLIRGAERKENLVYPNREWGYGTLNIYEALRILGR